jgi:hypothetical protein
MLQIMMENNMIFRAQMYYSAMNTAKLLSTHDWHYEWKGSQKRENITEYICKDTLTYNGIPAHTSDKTPKCIECSVIGEVKEGNGSYCNVYTEGADMDL